MSQDGIIEALFSITIAVFDFTDDTKSGQCFGFGKLL